MALRATLTLIFWIIFSQPSNCRQRARDQEASLIAFYLEGTSKGGEPRSAGARERPRRRERTGRVAVSDSIRNVKEMK